MDIIVCYDISSDKNRTRLAKKLRAFADRIQFSVFRIADAEDADRARVRRVVDEHLDPRTDRAHLILLCGNCVNGLEALGQTEPVADGVW